ncbi:chromosome loss-related protein [Saitoella coloradoensis]
MAPSISIPNLHLIPHSAASRRLLGRVSKDALIDLIISWLSAPNLHPRHVDPEEDEETLLSPKDAKDWYERCRAGSGGKRAAINRVLEVDWSEGLSCLQIAEVDMRYTIDTPTSQTYTAARLHYPPNTTLPPLHPPSLALKLAQSLSPFFKHHIYAVQHPTLPLHLLRLQIHDPPTPQTLTLLPPPKKILYIALCEGSNHVFHTGIGGAYYDMLRQCLGEVLGGKKGVRVEVRGTELVTRSLETMVELRGGGRGAGTAGGAWGVYAKGEVDDSPLQALPAPAKEEVADRDEDSEMRKRLKIADARFGVDTPPVLERVDFRLEETFLTGDGREDIGFAPKIQVRFEGPNVFEGLKELVVKGVIDGVKMPGWMTGEEGVTTGVVKNGRVVKRNLD